jgi:hypothetical protein
MSFMIVGNLIGLGLSEIIYGGRYVVVFVIVFVLMSWYVH